MKVFLAILMLCVRPWPEYENPEQDVESTAYCLRGVMANGQHVHDGAMATRDRGIPLGTRYQVMDGPLEGRVFMVEDRMALSAEANVDFWFASCDDARKYGRRQIHIAEVVAE